MLYEEKNMKTYFIRHTERMDIDEATFDKIVKDDLIAIHFPFDKSGDEKIDSESIDPDDYFKKNHEEAMKTLTQFPKKGGYEAMKTLTQLSEKGGYVCAEYRTVDGAIVGKINPETKIKLLEGKWGNRNQQQGRKATLKTLHLEKVKAIPPSEYLIISLGRPRQGTIRVWHNDNVGERIEHLVEGIPLEPILHKLSPTQQEVLCSEYLRSNLDDTNMLPKIQSFLLPVGRTLIDVDILGIDNQGKNIYSQVTHNKLAESKQKLEKLKKYLTGNSKAVLFCRCEAPKIIENIIVYPLQKVFDKYIESSIGQKWLKGIFGVYR